LAISVFLIYLPAIYSRENQKKGKSLILPFLNLHQH
jgi:hypothetical protein